MPDDAAAPPEPVPPREHRLGPGVALAVLAVYVAAQNVFAFAAMVLVMVTDAALVLGRGERLSEAHRAAVEGAAEPYVIFVGVVCAAGFVLLFANQVIRRRGGETYREAIGWRAGTRPQRYIGVVCGIACALALLLLAGWLLPVDESAEPGILERMARAGGVVRLLWVLMALGVAPALEEFLFRGVLYTGCARAWGMWPAAILTTLLFTALHWREARHYPPALGIILLLGAITIGQRIRTGALGPCIATHLAYNAAIVATAVGAR